MHPGGSGVIGSVSIPGVAWPAAGQGARTPPDSELIPPKDEQTAGIVVRATRGDNWRKAIVTPERESVRGQKKGSVIVSRNGISGQHPPSGFPLIRAIEYGKKI